MQRSSIDIEVSRRVVGLCHVQVIQASHGFPTGDEVDERISAYHTHPLRISIMVGDSRAGLFDFPIGLFDNLIQFAGSKPRGPDAFWGPSARSQRFFDAF